MKGWMFITTEGSPDFRTDEYMNEHPSFLSDNRDFILRTWRFDTENLDTMHRMLQGWKELDPLNHVIQEFCKRIGFDISVMKAYADKFRQR